MKIIHLSDLHFHKNNEDNKQIIETLKKVKTDYPEHYIVVTGDIVDDGHEQQYQNAAKELEKFKGRIFVAPGNHDFGASGTFYSSERAERFDEYLSKPLEQGGTFLAENKPVINVVHDGNDSAMFIALDTNLETSSPFDFSCGEFGDAQLNSLENILSDPDNSEMKKIVFFHHHPFMVNDPFMEIKDAGKFGRVVFRKADAILFGHKHVMNSWENRWRIRYFIASDNSPGKDKAGELTIKDGKLSLDHVDIAIH